MSTEIGEIKAGIVLTSLLEFFDELFISRSKSKEGEIKYQVDGPSGPLCRFNLMGDKVVFAPESSFGDKEKEVKELIEKRVSNVKFMPPIIEKPLTEIKVEAPGREPLEETQVEIEPNERRPIIPDTTGLITTVERESGSKIEYEGQHFELKTGQVPIPATSYMVSLGTFQKSWAVGVTRGRKVIGVEKISSLDPNIINGAIQKIIVIPLFSPYAASRAVQRLLDQVKT